MIALYIVLAVIVIVAIAVIVSYNRFVRQRNLVAESWRQVDVELQRRHDLIPNLVETVKGYAAHEKGVFEEITALRNQAASTGAGPAQQARQEDALTSGLGRLLAVAESYPDLKASANFLQLQAQLAETEDRLAAGRRFYNGNVRSLNTRVESFPSSLMANAMHISQAEYFETSADARTAPTLDLGPGSGPVAPPPVAPPSVASPPAGSPPPVASPPAAPPPAVS